MTFIERYPLNDVTIGNRSLVQFQPDLPLGPEDHGIGETSLTATVAMGVPALCQIQLTVEKAVKIAASETQVGGNDGVFDLAQAARPPLLNRGSFVAFLDVAGHVDDPNRTWSGVLDGHVMLQPTAHPVFVPLELAEELLRRPRRNNRFQSYWLDALLRQIGELPACVHTKLGARYVPTEILADSIEEHNKFDFRPTKSVGVHAMRARSPCETWILASRIGQGDFNLTL